MTPRKPDYRFLDLSEDNLDDLGLFPRHLDGFVQALPPEFKPLDDADPLDDGVAPTALGQAVMRYWAAATGNSEQDCPTGLVRASEALLCGIDGNLEIIQQATAGGRAAWESNHAGRLYAIDGLRGWTCAVAPAYVQPRGNTSYGALLRQAATKAGKKWPVIYKVGEGLTIDGASAEHFQAITSAQTKLLKPGEYRGKKAEFIDSLALEGIKEEIRAWMFNLQAADPNEDHCYSPTTGDGYTRITVSQSSMSALMDGARTDLWSLPWETGSALSLAPWTAATVMDLFDRLRFDAAPFDVWPTARTKDAVSRHLDDASPALAAVLRMMTVKVSLTFSVEPHKNHSTNTAVYADMARFHDPRQRPSEWRNQDQRAHVAKPIADALAEAGFIDDDAMHVMVEGEVIPWRTDENRSPFIDRVRAVTHTVEVMACEDMTLPRAEQGDPDKDSSALVRRTLRELQQTNSPKMRAACGAALATPVAGIEEERDANAVVAVLSRAFASNVIRKVGGKAEGRWTDLIDMDIDALHDQAAGDLEGLLETPHHGVKDSPAMKALAMLGLVAHAINPTLIEYRLETGTDENGNATSKRWPSSMTLTGRGNRAKVKGGSADAQQIVLNMARSPHGQDQLVAIVKAATQHDTPILPVHNGQELLEDDLRRLWADTPSRSGDPKPAESETPADPNDPNTPDDPDASEDRKYVTQADWDEDIDQLRSDIRRLKSRTAMLSEVPIGPDLFDGDPDDYDPDDESLPTMLDAVGIDEVVEGGLTSEVNFIVDFFNRGVRAFLRRSL